jgi:hypothetical protein
MRLLYCSMMGLLSAFSTAGVVVLLSAAPAHSAETESDEVEILTRGPVHEAFAESVISQPEPGLIVTAVPPAPIEELPPDEQPEGENVTWISGYWAWDDDQNDFLWVSGIWRNLPPGRQWVPGYWSALGDGRHQWTSGYWADSETGEVTYIPTAPPRSLDVGPNIAAPSDDHTWIPGNWIWADDRYGWRPGYWTPLRDDWTWVPSRYCWSPRGYISVDGYWDYAVGGRGVLFAPVHFRREVYVEPSYSYIPSVVVDVNVFTDHLFVRPRCGHYYFGDYYAPRYVSLGFFPSHRWHARRGCFEPIYAHHRWHHRHDRNWDRRRQDHFNYFRDNAEARPAHNWAAMRSFRGDRFSNDERGRTRQFARSFGDFARDPAARQRFRTLDNDRRSAFVAQRQEMRNFGQQRRQIEARGGAPGDRAGKVAVREKFSRSPVIGPQMGRVAKGETPPMRPEPRGGPRRNPTSRGELDRDIVRGENSILPNRPRATPAERNTERGFAVGGEPGRGREAERRAAAARDNASKSQPRERPGRTPELTPERTPRPQAVRESPARTLDATPPRRAQPNTHVRPTPQRKAQAARERDASPMVQARPNPHRQSKATQQRHTQARHQVRPVPQREPRVVQQRQSQAKSHSRQASQRMARPAPQRQSHASEVRHAARRQNHASPQVNHAAPRQSKSAHHVQPNSQVHRTKPSPNRQPSEERKRSKKDRSDA